MASSVIHIAVANELNKKLKRDSQKLLIGTIAPDISKLVGENKTRSHFLNGYEGDIPDIDKFLYKYRDYLSDDFVLGYYIHLYVDYLWFKYFMSEIYYKNSIKKLDGTIIECDSKLLMKYIYNDYTNLNKELIEDYNLDFKIFYNDIPKFKNIIDEIPMDKLNLIINKTFEIILNSKEEKELVFNMDNIHKFIDLSIELITSNLIDLRILEKGEI